MSEKTSGAASGRTEKGQFAAGNPGGPGNPYARQVAALRKAVVQSATAQDVADVMATVKLRALGGDMAAARLWLAYCRRHARREPRPGHARRARASGPPPERGDPGGRRHPPARAGRPDVPDRRRRRTPPPPRHGTSTGRRPAPRRGQGQGPAAGPPATRSGRRQRSTARGPSRPRDAPRDRAGRRRPEERPAVADRRPSIGESPGRQPTPLKVPDGRPRPAGRSTPAGAKRPIANGDNGVPVLSVIVRVGSNKADITVRDGRTRSTRQSGRMGRRDSPIANGDNGAAAGRLQHLHWRRNRREPFDRPRHRAPQRRRGRAPCPSSSPASNTTRSRRHRGRGNTRSRRGVDGVRRGRARRKLLSAPCPSEGALASGGLSRDLRLAETLPATPSGRASYAYRQSGRDGPSRRGRLRSARPRARVHTYHGHVLSGYFSRRWERLFRGIERMLAYTSGTLIAVSDEVRGELVGFTSHPPTASRSFPTASTCRRGATPTRSRGERSGRNQCRRRHLRRWVGRPSHRDQAPARSRPHAAGARRPARSTHCSCSWATARIARRSRRSRPSSGSPTTAASSASRRASVPGTPRSTR